MLRRDTGRSTVSTTYPLRASPSHVPLFRFFFFDPLCLVFELDFGFGLCRYTYHPPTEGAAARAVQVRRASQGGDGEQGR